MDVQRYSQRVGTAVGIIGGVGGVTIGAIASFSKGGPPAWLDKAVPWIGPGIFALIAIAVGPLILSLVFGSAKQHSEARRLERVGRPGTATIVSMTDTGVTVNNDPEARFVVEMDGTQATFTSLVSRIAFPSVGQTIPVIYDPSDPSVMLPESMVKGSRAAGAPGSAPAPSPGGHGQLAFAKQMLEEAKAADAIGSVLNDTGSRAHAIVTSFEPTGIMVNGQSPLARVKVKVMPVGGTPFDAELLGAFSAAGLAKYQPGKEIGVVYDPADPSKVSVDREWMKTAAQQAAGDPF